MPVQLQSNSMGPAAYLCCCNAGWSDAGLLLSSACKGWGYPPLCRVPVQLCERVHGAHPVTMLHGMHSSTPACFACWVTVGVAASLLPWLRALLHACCRVSFPSHACFA